MKIITETERLVIREIIPADAPGFFEMDSNPKVHTYLGNNPVKNIEESRQVIKGAIQRYEDDGISRWTMIEKATGDFVGWTGLLLMKEKINDHIDYYDLGYRLVEKHWGKGYATESAIASLKYGFEIMNLENIYAVAAVGNTASIHVLEKAGLKRGKIVEAWGHDHYWFQINQDAWKKR